MNKLQLQRLILCFPFSCWCLDCKAIPKESCDGLHTILDQMKDVNDIDAMKAQVSSLFSQGIEKRQQIVCHLKAVLAANVKCLDKLRSLAAMKLLSAYRTSSASVKKKLEEVTKEAEKEVDEAERMWNNLNANKELTVRFFKK